MPLELPSLFFQQQGGGPQTSSDNRQDQHRRPRAAIPDNRLRQTPPTGKAAATPSDVCFYRYIYPGRLRKHAPADGRRSITPLIGKSPRAKQRRNGAILSMPALLTKQSQIMPNSRNAEKIGSRLFSGHGCFLGHFRFGAFFGSRPFNSRQWAIQQVFIDKPCSFLTQA